MSTTLVVTPTLATQAGLDATNAKLATLTGQVTGLATTMAALAVELGIDEQKLATLVAAQPPVVPPPVVPPSPVGLIFSSDWPVTGPGSTNGTGAPRDTWDTYDEFNGGSGTVLLSVVDGASVNAPGGRNALKVVQAGDPPGYAANLRKLGLIVPGVDYYVRWYFRTDDTSQAGDHIVTCHYQNYGSLTHLRKMGGPTDWQPIKSFFGCGYVYPIGHWYLRQRLPNKTWFRFEDFVHWTSPTAIQVHPRIYDASGTLLYQDVDYQQSDFGQSGNLSWGGRDDWTLENYYAAGHDFCVDPMAMTEFGLGNNGQQGSTSTGLPWYFAGVAVSTQGWIGP